MQENTEFCSLAIKTYRNLSLPTVQLLRVNREWQKLVILIKEIDPRRFSNKTLLAKTCLAFSSYMLHFCFLFFFVKLLHLYKPYSNTENCLYLEKSYYFVFFRHTWGFIHSSGFKCSARASRTLPRLLTQSVLRKREKHLLKENVFLFVPSN